MSGMGRREFVASLGGAAAAWPLTARAQQPAMPMVGFLDLRSPDAMEGRLRGFRQGLRDTGNVEGDNITIAYRWAENKVDRLPELVAELIRGRIAVIIASGGVAAAVAAKAATTTIPILFIVSEDPVRLGLVASLARPSGNLTGVNFFNTELAAKQLELLRELLPRAARVVYSIARRSERGGQLPQPNESILPAQNGDAEPRSACAAADEIRVNDHASSPAKG
jgi:putative tryptophan/tyrosine transport system substrate-binding protein